MQVLRSPVRDLRSRVILSTGQRHSGAGMTDQVTAGRFVGRTQELARLRELAARAANGQPLVALLGGEAGVGKTRLVEELAATAAQPGGRGLRGRWVAPGGGRR